MSKSPKRYISDIPELMAEWDWEKNNELGLDPSKITIGSRTRAHWICDKGHKWEAVISARTFRQTGCPYCSGRRAIKGQTDLATTHPEIAKEWHPTKNGNLKPTDIFAGNSRTQIWWQCEHGHEWKTTPNSRKGGARCPRCVDESRTSFPEQAIFFYLQQVTTAYNRYQISPSMEIDVYLPELKIGIEYDGFYYHTNQRTIQKEQQKDQYCLQSGITLIRIKEVKDSKIIKREQNIIYCHHRHPGSSLTETINTLLKYIELLTTQSFNINVDIEKDRSMIHNQYIYIEKHNSIQYTHPEICKYWNYDKNGRLQPNLFSYGSNKKVWWKCPICGYEWQAKINNKIRGNPCPQCTPQEGSKNYI